MSKRELAAVLNIIKEKSESKSQPKLDNCRLV